MKELSIEQKAKAYDIALDKIKRLLGTGSNCSREELEYVFPELKESEGERIRKELIDYFKENNAALAFRGISNECVIAWLEKQGEQKFTDTDNRFIRMRESKPKDISEFLDRLTTVEQEFLWEHIAKIRELDKEEQKKSYDTCDSSMMDNKKSPYGEKRDFGYFEEKSADKVEPKFKVGDWVFIEEIEGYKQGAFQIKSIDEFGYNFDEYHIIPLNYEELLSKWTIQDAKDGDVLVASDGSIFVFAGAVDCACKHYVALATDDVIKFNKGLEHYWETSRAVHPATKEQRDTLMKAMADAGWEFDFEKKELKKIVVPIFKIGDTIIKKHNSDILYFGSFTITDITGGKYWYNDRIICDITEQDDWELVEQKPAAWNERDDSNLGKAIWYVENPAPMVVKDSMLVEWLKSLKDRIQPQSYERNRLLVQLEEWLDEYVSNLTDVDTATLICSFTNYLDGKLPKSFRPQSQWKPSNEQMDALNDVISSRDIKYDVLSELWKDLKKLRDE